MVVLQTVLGDIQALSPLQIMAETIESTLLNTVCVINDTTFSVGENIINNVMDLTDTGLIKHVKENEFEITSPWVNIGEALLRGPEISYHDVVHIMKAQTYKENISSNGNVRFLSTPYVDTYVENIAELIGQIIDANEINPSVVVNENVVYAPTEDGYYLFIDMMRIAGMVTTIGDFIIIGDGAFNKYGHNFSIPTPLDYDDIVKDIQESFNDCMVNLLKADVINGALTYGVLGFSSSNEEDEDGDIHTTVTIKFKETEEFEFEKVYSELHLRCMTYIKIYSVDGVNHVTCEPSRFTTYAEVEEAFAR